MMSSGYDLVFTPKFDRFNFWLENTYPVTSQSEGLLLKVE
jgi:hypothetical protein